MSRICKTKAKLISKKKKKEMYGGAPNLFTQRKSKLPKAEWDEGRIPNPQLIPVQNKTKNF